MPWFLFLSFLSPPPSSSLFSSFSTVALTFTHDRPTSIQPRHPNLDLLRFNAALKAHAFSFLPSFIPSLSPCHLSSPSPPQARLKNLQT